MANLVISAAGATVGYLIGGPVGAEIGWMVGSYVGAPKTTINQPTLGDLRIQTSQYGVSIPIVVGRQRLAGNIIWATEKVPYETKTTQGGGKGGGGVDVVTTGYKMSLAISLCKGPILGVTKVWQDGQAIVTAPDPTPCTVYFGNNTQLPDPTMEGNLGVGNVPAYRGLAYVVLTNFDLGVGGRVPIFSFEVLKEGGINS